MEAPKEVNTALTAAQPNTTSWNKPNDGNKGGRGARNKRRDVRRSEQNQEKDRNIKSAAALELGLDESSELKNLEPQCSLRPGGVKVSLLGIHETTHLMLKRLTAVAQRPLAILLNRQENILAYRKVAAYIATARVAAAQTSVPYAVGEALEMVGTITSDEFRVIDGRSSTLPSFLAWSLANVGTFQIDSCINVPVIPNPTLEDVQLQDVFSGNYFTIARIVQAGPLRQLDVPTIRRLSEILPQFACTNAGAWTPQTIAFWQDAPPSANEWTAFTTINAAVKEQNLAVTGFKVTSATGSLSQTLRFPQFEPNTITTRYYSLVPLAAATIRPALVLRLGLDEFRERTRFMGDPESAILNGYDTPIVYIEAQLSMLTKTEIRS